MLSPADRLSSVLQLIRAPPPRLCNGPLWRLRDGPGSHKYPRPHLSRKSEQQRSNYSRLARDHTRASVLNQVDSLWETSARGTHTSPAAEQQLLEKNMVVQPVALKGRALPAGERAPARLVFLVDTSGSMAQPDSLPLVQQSLQLLLAQLAPNDRVALVSYAGESRVVLASTPVQERAVIESAIKSLSSSGGTNGSGACRRVCD